MGKTLTVALIGGGNRGVSYTEHMRRFPDRYKIVALAEPQEGRREAVKKAYEIADDMCFENWDDCFAKGKLADIAVIATQDKDHYIPAMKAISLGYDIMLEKPISPSPKECIEIARYAKEMNVRVVVCHVLRYTPHYTTIKNLIDSGELGDILTINHEENVGHTHHACSYVRGPWGNTERSSNMLLAKSCHDLDLIQWLLNKRCKKIQSFGALSYFREENAPKDAPERCHEGCPHEETCPYSALKIYVKAESHFWRRHATQLPDPTEEDAMELLRTTRYGKCVFKCDNDVVDHQTVNMLFEDNTTATFTMSSTNKGGRWTHIMGTKKEAYIGDAQTPIRLFDLSTKEMTEIEMNGGGDGAEFGHGGGDYGIVRDMYDYFIGKEATNQISDIGISAENHLLVFAAEQARAEGTVVDIEEYINSLQEERE